MGQVSNSAIIQDKCQKFVFFFCFLSLSLRLIVLYKRKMSVQKMTTFGNQITDRTQHHLAARRWKFYITTVVRLIQESGGGTVLSGQGVSQQARAGSGTTRLSGGVRNNKECDMDLEWRPGLVMCPVWSECCCWMWKYWDWREGKTSCQELHFC